jgi:hypothetical protein
MHTTEIILDLGLGGNAWARRVTFEALAASNGPSEGHMLALEVLAHVSCGDFPRLALVAAREGIGYEGLKALLEEAQSRCEDWNRGWWEITEEAMRWVTCSGTTRVTLSTDGSALVERQAPKWVPRGRLWETVWTPAATWQVDPNGDVIATGWSTLGRPELIELLAPLEPTSAEAFERKLDAAADAADLARRREAAYWGPGPQDRRGHRRGKKPRCPWRD